MRELLRGRTRGVCLRDVPGGPSPSDAAFRPAAAMAAAVWAGAELLHLPDVRVISPTLDPGQLDAAREMAEGLGLALSASLPAVHPDRREALWGEDPSAVTHPAAQIRAASRLRVRSLHVTVGQDDDRFRRTPSWSDQRARTVPVLEDLVGRAEAPVVLKTHEEMTTFEVLELCGHVPGLRVGFSPVNVVARLEDPLAAALRVAELVHTVFLDDCVLARTPEGLRRVMQPIGGGSLPWPEMLAALPVTAPVVVDLHRAQLSMPLYDPEWLAFQPDLDVGELARVFEPAVTTTEDAPLARRVAAAADLLRATG